MVAVRSHEADRFLAREVAGFSAYLVFGPDVGLVSERVRAIVKALVDDPADPFQVVRLRSEDVAGDPGRLADETNTIPMFGGRRAIMLEATGRDIAAALAHHLASAAPSPVVIEAGVLRKDAPLRKAIERARNAVAIECYPDDEGAVVRLIETEIAAAGLTIEAEAKAMLATLLGADRMASRGEIAKLTLYAHGRPAIGIEDVEAVVADAAAQATDALIDATFAGDLKAVELAGRRVLTGPAEAGTFLGAALRHATFLHRAKLDLGNGASIDQVMMAATRIGAVGKRRDGVRQQIMRVGVEALEQAVVRLGQSIGQVRLNPPLAQDLGLRTLWTIARSVQRHRLAP